MRHYNLLGGIILVVAITPIVINYILTREIICNYDVAGSGIDWISFYGSYSGSIITSIIAYVIMYKTIKSNEQQTMVTIRQSKLEHLKIVKKQELDFVRNDASERLGRINISEIFRVALFPKDFNIKEEIERLNDLYVEYTKLSNSSLLFYGTAEGPEYFIFYTKYNSLIKEICQTIDSLTKEMVPYLYINDRTQLIDSLLKYKDSMNQLNKKLPQVLDAALKLCKRIKSEADSLC